MAGGAAGHLSDQSRLIVFFSGKSVMYLARPVYERRIKQRGKNKDQVACENNGQQRWCFINSGECKNIEKHSV